MIIIIMYLGIDTGGTYIAAGIVTDCGDIFVKDSILTLRQRNMDDIVKDIAELSKRIIAD